MVAGIHTVCFMKVLRLEEMISRFVTGTVSFKFLLETLLDLIMLEEAKNQQERLKKIAGACGAYRNGYRKRKLKTQYGELVLHVPEFRHSTFKTCLFKPYCRVNGYLEELIREAYLDGISTRRMKNLLKKIGISGISASAVSRIFAQMDEKVADFLKKPLLDPYRYVEADATYISVCTNGKYVKRPLMLAVGVGDDGIWHVLGAKLAYEENYETWKEFFRELEGRGLRGVELVVSDLRNGVREAAKDTFGGASFQLCNNHLLARVKGLMAKNDLKKIEDAEYQFKHSGRKGYGELIRVLETLGYQKPAGILRENQRDALAYLQFPLVHRRTIYSTNVIENVNRQLKRRIDKIGDFPLETSVMRMAGTLLMRMDTEGTVRKSRMVFAEREKIADSEDDFLYGHLTTFDCFTPVSRRDVVYCFW